MIKRWSSKFWTATCVTLLRDGREVGKLETNPTGRGMAQVSADDIRFILDACNEKENQGGTCPPLTNEQMRRLLDSVKNAIP